MILKNFSQNNFKIFLFILLIFLIDRFTKIYVIYLVEKNNFTELLTSKFLNIHLIWNEGVAFGLFAFDENYLYNILTVIIFLIIVLLIFFINNCYGLKKYSLLMIAAGACGNLFYRIFYRAVPDFIDFHVGNFHWFIFNIADIFITIGVIFMIFIELITSDKIVKK